MWHRIFGSFPKTFNLVPGVPGFWARGGEEALAEPPRAARPRPHSGRIKFSFFSTCGSRNSAKNPTCDGTSDSPGVWSCQVDAIFPFFSTCGSRKSTQFFVFSDLRQPRVGPNRDLRCKFGFWPTCGCRKSKKMKNWILPECGRVASRDLGRLAAAASRKKSKNGSTCGCRKWKKIENLDQLAAAASRKKWKKCIDLRLPQVGENMEIG